MQTILSSKLMSEARAGAPDMVAAGLALHTSFAAFCTPLHTIYIHVAIKKVHDDKKEWGKYTR